MKKIAWIALLSGALLAEAQKPVEVTVERVNDRRSKGFFAELTIALRIPSIKSADVAASRVLVTSAVDDLGTSLLDPEAQEPRLEMNMPGEGPVDVSVTLENPPRKAKQVREVRGNIELYMPSKDPNSVAEIPKFTAQSGKTLSHKALKANGVEITLLSAAQIAAEKKKLADAKRKELQEIGYQGEDLESMVSSHMEYVLRLEESDLLVRVKDPKQSIQEVTYVDAAGEVKRVNMRNEDGGYAIFSTWEGAPKPDWKMRVSMKTAKNLVRHPFVLKDVTLP
jgi:hypothetical protein